MKLNFKALPILYLISTHCGVADIEEIKIAKLKYNQGSINQNAINSKILI